MSMETPTLSISAASEAAIARILISETQKPGAGRERIVATPPAWATWEAFEWILFGFCAGWLLALLFVGWLG